jgi:hypothetical protein
MSHLLTVTKPVEPDRVYHEAEVIVELGWTYSDLRRARDTGLRFRELGRGRRVYRGCWIVEWLEGKP